MKPKNNHSSQTKPKIMIERAGNLTKHGIEAIRAVAGTEKEYETYVNKYSKDKTADIHSPHNSDQSIKEQNDTSKDSVLDSKLDSVLREEAQRMAPKPNLKTAVSENADILTRIKYLKDTSIIEPTFTRESKNDKLKGMSEMLDAVQKIINEMFPKCICEGDCIDKNCPNELMDGAWTDYYNKELTEKITRMREELKK